MEYIRLVDSEAGLRVVEVLEIGDGLIEATRAYHGQPGTTGIWNAQHN